MTNAPDRFPPTAGEPRAISYREVTIGAVVFGVILGVVMNAAITYAGLKIGFTIVGSAIAAVLGFGVLRGLLRRGSILETNIAQTVATSVNTTNAGIIFTVPVLMLMGHRLDPGSAEFWLITLACMAGSVLGVAFIVPLRKQMIDIDRLRFPSGTAVGAILKSPGAGARKSVVLAAGALLAVVVYLPAGLPAITRPARADQLDGLVARERITPAQAALTRSISGWIDARSAPRDVAEKGALVAERIGLSNAPDDGGADHRVRLAEIASAIEALPGAAGFSDPLCRAVHDAARGERTWDSLRGADTGWARAPLPGYQDLGFRLRAERRPGSDELTPRVDRDRNGRPDFILTDDRVDAGRWFGLPDEMQLAFAIAPFALGAGYLTGRAGLMVLAGGVLAYLVLNPLAFRLGWMPATVPAHQAAGHALGAFNRPLGIGLLLGGAMAGVLASLPAIREAIRGIARAGTGRGGSDEMSLRTIAVAAVIGMAGLFVAVEFVGEPTASSGWLSGLHPVLAKLLIVLVAGAWIWFAGVIIAQCTGMTDWSPISGMALLTVVLVMLLAGRDDVLSAVVIGAALCVAISLASDMMADLRTGHIVGGVPRRQQVLELATAPIGPAVTMLTLVLIAGVNMKQAGVPIGPGTPTVAPQAQALQAVVAGVQGGQMPYAMYGIGAVLGALLGVGSFPGLGVLVGLSMYLPIVYILTYGVGCVMNMLVGWVKGRTWAEEWGVPFCAGLIVGEAILALGINAVVLLLG